MIQLIIKKIDKNIASFDNNSLLIRYILSFADFYSHMFAIYGLPEPTFLFGNHSLGWYAVNGFFFISGILVSQSFYNKNLNMYILARGLRILPAYIFALIFSILIIILFDNLTITYDLVIHYINFIMHNLLPFNEIIHGGIPTVWSDSGLASVVNTSIWTIPLEIFCYIFIVPLLLLDIKIKYKLFFGFISLYFIFNLGIIVNGNIKYDLLRVMVYFALGVTFFSSIKMKKISLYFFIFFIFLFIFEGSLRELLMGYITILLIVYFGLYLKSVINFENDYSYGFYLYAFPISQAVNAKIGGVENIYAGVSIAFIFLLVTSYLSWIFIEKPFLKKKITIKKESNNV